jgi:uncharacterized MAPEG superfamily protein
VRAIGSRFYSLEQDMIIKTVIILALLFIVYNLGYALFYLVRKPHDPKRVAKALTWRIGLSLAVFGLLVVAYLLGWITPNNPFYNQ